MPLLHSLRGKLTMTLVLLTCVPILIMGVVLSYQAEDHVLDQAEDRLAGIANTLDAGLAPNLGKMLEHDPSLGLAKLPSEQQDAAIRQTIAMALQKVSANHPGIVVGFSSSDNRLFIAMMDGVEKAAENPFTRSQPWLSMQRTAASRLVRQPINRRYMYPAPLIRDGVQIGQIFACAPDTDVVHAVLRIRLITLADLALALLAAWWVARRLGRHLLSHVFAAVEQAAAGVQDVPSELSDLAPIWGFLHSLVAKESSLATDLLNAIPLGVILYNKQLKVAYINQYYADILGIPSHEIIRSDYEDLTRRIFAAEDLASRVVPAVHAGHAKVARQRQTLISAKGERIPAETVAFPFGSEQGLQGILCLVNDLRQDEDLARMRKILSFVNEAGPVGMVTLDTNGLVTDFNQAMTRICGLPRDRAVGQKVGKLFPSLVVNPDGAHEFRNQMINCPCSHHQDEHVCPCSQHGRYLVVDGTITRDGRGMVTGMILVFRDITQLREMESRLHEALQQAQFLLDALDVGIIAVDHSGRISVFNHVAESAAELTAVDVHGQAISSLALAPQLSTLLLDSLNAGVPHRNHVVSWTVGGDKHEFILDCSPLTDAEGTIAGAMTMFRDITTLRRLQRDVERSEKLSVIGQLAAGTAHEIRNPLTTVRGFLQILKEKCHKSSWEHEVSYIDLMLGEIDRINHVISEFLMLAKDRPALLQILSLGGLLSDIGAILESEALLRGINLKTELPGQPIPILGDREQLKQVFLNLATNAFQAMNSGGSLTIRVQCADDRVKVEMADTGCGIPPEVQSKIFDPFFSTKEEGTGLGLAICNRIVTDHHGEIHVASTLGEGTTVTVELPLRGGM